MDVRRQDCAVGSAARPYPAEALHVCDCCFGPLEVAYDYERHRGHDQPGADRGRAPHHLALRRPAAGVDAEAPVDLGAGFTPLVRADRLAAELGLGELWIKNDTAQPDRLVQGPGRVGGADQGPGARLQGGRLRLDRQPGQLGGRPRGPGRDASRWCSSPTTSSRPRWSPPPSTAARSSPSRATTTTSTGCAPSWPASTRAGRSSTSTCAPTTPRAPRPSPSRWPSSSAGRRPTTWWCRSARAAS